MTDGYTININGQLLDLGHVRVMGILNVTTDSFFSESRCLGHDAIALKARQLAAQGADIIDIGACSTRPDAQPVSEAEEHERLTAALRAVRSALPDAILSIDTFRAGIAKMAVEEFGVGIVNDISAGAFDAEMFPTVAKLGVPYVLTHGCRQPDNQATAVNPIKQEPSAKETDITEEVMLFFAEKTQQLRDLGQKDIILDPGFGFGKTLDENYRLLANLHMLTELDLPILVGVSRKSMIYKLMGTSPEQALNGTTVVHTICLQQQACHILRVHDVEPAKEAIAIVGKTLAHNQET